ncbi:Nup54 and/or Med3 domain containing protein, partial [Asbolus verrucosus]
ATAFGTPFGVTTTTASTGFGGFGSSFGSTTQQPAAGFGSSFGAQSATTPAFGSTFGAPSSSTPAFGSTFGAPASTTAPTFGTGFGSTAGSGLFGTSTTKPSLFGTPATSASLFSTPASSAPSLFGTASTTQTPSLFGSVTTTTPSLFGAGNTSAPNLFGAPATSTPNLFGSTFGGAATTSAPSLFGSTAAGSAGFGLFGSTTTTTAPSLFGGFGNTQSAGGFGGFGSSTAGTGGFGGTQAPTSSLFGGAFGAKPAVPIGVAQNAQTVQQQQNQQVMASIYAINIYNDERDDILKKWNLLQACWGTGKGYYNPNCPPVEYTIYNPFYRFKAVGYNIIPEHDNSEGLVKLIFNRKYSDLSNQKQVLINGIGGILGNKPNLKVIIQHIKAISDTQSEIRIVVVEKGVTGSSRKIAATDLSAYLNQPTQKQQLTNVGVTSIVAYVTPSKAALEEYLRTVPLGFDPQMWKAAIADNPNPSKYMPVPIYGFSDLKTRKLKQEHETGLHKAFEEKINNELTELKKKQAASIARINELKHRFLHLQHRTLRILVRQESIRKNGIAIQPEEEYLKGKLETMYAHLNVPTQFKGQLNELISTVKLMENTTRPPQPRYKLLPESQGELKEFLQLQQNGISKLVDIVKEDMRSLNIMTDGMRQILQNKSVMP